MTPEPTVNDLLSAAAQHEKRTLEHKPRMPEVRSSITAQPLLHPMVREGIQVELVHEVGGKPHLHVRFPNGEEATLTIPSMDEVIESERQQVRECAAFMLSRALTALKASVYNWSDAHEDFSKVVGSSAMLMGLSPERVTEIVVSHDGEEV